MDQSHEISQRHPPDKPAGPLTSSPQTEQQSQFRAVLAFIGRRLLFSTGVLLAIFYIAFFALTAAQGSSLGSALSGAFGQTARYVLNLLQGDLGRTVAGSVAFRPQEIMEVLPEAMRRSLGLMGVTFLIGIALGVPLGVWAAYRRHTRGALFILLVSFVGISTPVFFLALFLQIAAIEYTHTFGQSIVPVGGYGWDRHLVLPMLVLAARPMAQITRVTFITVSEHLDQDYVRVARGKGLRSRQIILGHILRNAAIPIMTTVAVSLRFVLSSLPVVEAYFGWGGLGETLLRAMFNGDTNLTIALVAVLGLIFIAINLILDASYYYIDPRIQQSATIGREFGPAIGLLGWLKGLPITLRGMVANNPLRSWLRRLRGIDRKEPSPFRAILEKQQLENVAEAPTERASRWAAVRFGLLGNAPLLFGTLIVGGLIFLMFFGPQLAPLSPNTTQQIAVIDGVITVPPFAPSERHPWGTDNLGRDIMSLILAGVQQTLILAFAVVVVRMTIGTFLGILAGWFNGSWLDQLIRGVIQAVAVFPTLLLAAFLILAFGIQNGIRTFFIALFLVGWGEIAEFVRAEVISIRGRPFIESAVAAGQSTARLIRVHFLPNLAPGLISVAAVEVSAVLLILGELGFIGIFISGGAGTDFGLYSQVPEWGSLLSGVRRWVRSYPWTGFYPTAAFFVAILGFNLFGEGLRRLFGRIGIIVNMLISRYSLIFVAGAVAFFFWFRGNSGELVFYRQQADTFNASNAMAHVQALTADNMEGRALGSEGINAAAAYIAQQFRSLELQPAGESLSYQQQDSRTYFELDGAPSLVIQDGGQDPVYRQDFTVFPKTTASSGAAEGPVTLLAPGLEAGSSVQDFAGQVVMLLSHEDLAALQEAECAGVLVIAEDLGSMKQRYTLAGAAPQSGCGKDTPVLWISDRLANRLLAGSGENTAALQERRDGLGADELFLIQTSTEVSFEINGEIRQNVPVVNVLGQLPGTSDQLDSNLIIVAAQYDSPPSGPDGVYPEANSTASGVAVLLEAIRTMQESGYEPFKTFLFVAYSGEGVPDLAAAPPVQHFLEARTGFSTAYEIEGVIYLRGLGGGGESLEVSTTGRSDVAKLLETAIHLAGLETTRITSTPTLNLFLPGLPEYHERGESIEVGLARQGWQATAHSPSDTISFVTEEQLGEAGRAITLGLMILGRDQNY